MSDAGLGSRKGMRDGFSTVGEFPEGMWKREQGASGRGRAQAKEFGGVSDRSGGFPGSSAGKESTCNAGDLGSVPGSGRYPGGGHGNPLQYSCLENSHGQRSLAGNSPWGCKESDMTEHSTADKSGGDGMEVER